MRDIQERDMGYEMLKEKIKIIAEVFEKRAIGDQYTVEVLCDFIYDKSKKVMSRYGGTLEENKVLKAEQSLYFQKNHDRMASEIKDLKNS